jgi:hypothetical protein
MRKSPNVIQIYPCMPAICMHERPYPAAIINTHARAHVAKLKNLRLAAAAWFDIYVYNIWRAEMMCCSAAKVVYTADRSRDASAPSVAPGWINFWITNCRLTLQAIIYGFMTADCISCCDKLTPAVWVERARPRGGIRLACAYDNSAHTNAISKLLKVMNFAYSAL